jgi:hypothetical protein
MEIQNQNLPQNSNPRLKSLLLILIFTFIASGATLICLKFIQDYHREQIYLATEATLPVHKAEKSASEPTGMPDDISDWKTYRNEKYGFEIKCPADSKYSEESDKNYLDPPTAFFCGSGESSIGILPIGGFLYELPFINPKITKEYVAGKQAIKYHWEYQSGSGLISDAVAYHIIEPVNHWKVCEIEVLTSCNRIVIGALNKKGLQSAQQILSTFKFIDSLNTSDSNTHSNEKYGSELKSPVWETYKDDVNGFQFDYPIFTNKDRRTVEGSKVNFESYWQQNNTFVKNLFLDYEKINSSINLSQWLKENENEGEFALKNYPFVSAYVRKNYEGTSPILAYIACPRSSCVISIGVYFQDNLLANYTLENFSASDYIKLTDRILSTFKFIE